MSKITLQCIKEGRKLRIKFHSYTDISGNTYTNVYDNTLNCQFPKNIREAGLFYEIIPEALTIQEKNGARPFYKINRANIKIVQPVIDTSNLKIFEINECVVCLDNQSTEIFIPCCHKCICNVCYIQMKIVKNYCPICRRNITSITH